ncbi:hypothetical protein [Pelagibius sp.]
MEIIAVRRGNDSFQSLMPPPERYLCVKQSEPGRNPRDMRVDR